jgi:phosphoribosylformylglycinamidine synthase
MLRTIRFIFYLTIKYNNMKKLSYFYFPNGPTTEIVFAVEHTGDIPENDLSTLIWLLNPNSFEKGFSMSSTLPAHTVHENIFYVGPNLRIETPESEKIVAIMQNCGLTYITRVEKFRGDIVDPGAFDHFKAMHMDRMTEACYEYGKLPNHLATEGIREKTHSIKLIENGKAVLEKLNKEHGFGMDDFDIQMYYDLFVQVYKRNPNEIELAQLAQGNSSHCRHWEFNGTYVLNNIQMPRTLFEMVKGTLHANKEGSILAFKDNGGILEGGDAPMWICVHGVYKKVFMQMNHTATAETHNHPSLISPFPGAATGVGGRLRDISDIQTGALIGFGALYFQTGRLDQLSWTYPSTMAHPRDVLKGAIQGASSYGNPFGEPTLAFLHDSVGITTPDGTRIESIKPIIYTGAIGSIPADAKKKVPATKGILVVRLGGQVYKVGVGGGAASSIDAGSNNSDLDFKSVQRGEPMVARSVYNVIRECVLLGANNPIDDITDQGAGGPSNAITELISKVGAMIYLGNFRIADALMTDTEVWIAEAQEQHALLVDKSNIERLKKICKKHNCPIEIVGETTGDGRLQVIGRDSKDTIVDLKIDDILGELPSKTYTDQALPREFKPFAIPSDTSLHDLFKRVAYLTGVCLPTYMVNTFDGSVGGLAVQGPRDGIHLLPVTTYGVKALGYEGTGASVGTIIRSNPIAMQIDVQASSRMVIANVLTTMMFACIPGGIQRIKGRLNEMWAFKIPGGKARLYNALEAITDTMCEIGLGIDGGKDSLSMVTSFDGQKVPSFDTLVYEAYAHMDNFKHRITPSIAGNGTLIYIDLAQGQLRMGGSALAQSYEETGNEVPDLESTIEHQQCFAYIQTLIKKKLITAGMGKQKGGLIVTLAKMMISTNYGITAKIPFALPAAAFLFNEESGIVIETKNADAVLRIAQAHGLTAVCIGKTVTTSARLTIKDSTGVIFDASRNDLHSMLTETSKDIEIMNGVPEVLAQKEWEGPIEGSTPTLILKHDPTTPLVIGCKKVFKVAVLSAPGTNGEDELGYLFGSVKNRFEVHSVSLAQLQSGEIDLKDFNVIAFAGGFSFGDVLGSGKGFAGSIRYNEKLTRMFRDFFARPDTLSCGVCNGMQIGTLLGIFDADTKAFGMHGTPRMTHNKSGRFEHRPVRLHIPDTRSIMFKGMAGAVMPTWSAHAEGNFYMQDHADYLKLLHAEMICMQYADYNGRPTTEYPHNPNGSPLGIAGICTRDGRHTYFMPHIERGMHLPYIPTEWKEFRNSIWKKCPENMYAWLAEHA